MILPLTASNVDITIGESILFWIVAPVMVLAAIGIALSRKAVHAALCMVAVMLGCAAIYVANDATFLGVVQVVVYTGAIMMLVLFVIMMVGVSASDNYHNTSRAARFLAWLMALVGGGLLIALTVMSFGFGTRKPAPLQGSGTNPVDLATTLFSQHMFTMELVAALLITAAIGAVTLTHTDRLKAKMGQINTSHHKMELYAAKGLHIGQLPAPGVYVGGNAPDAPAISGETGGPVLTSVPRVLRVRGLDRSLAEVAPAAVEALRQQKVGDPAKGLHTFAANRQVAQSQSWGMPGQAEEFTLRQPGTRAVAKAEPDAAAVDLDTETTTEQEGEN